MTFPSLPKLRKSLGCLIPRNGAAVPSCHEFSVCDCTVLALLDRIEALESEVALARERLGPAGIAMLKDLQRLRNKEEKK